MISEAHGAAYKFAYLFVPTWVNRSSSLTVTGDTVKLCCVSVFSKPRTSRLLRSTQLTLIIWNEEMSSSIQKLQR